MSFALQHCRQQLARLVAGKAPRKVLLQSEGGQAIAVPSALLALHSQLFDELFESLLEGEGTPEVSEAAAWCVQLSYCKHDCSSPTCTTCE
jgi:hypothetical protein